MESPNERPDEKAVNANTKHDDAQDKGDNAKTDLPTVDPRAKSHAPPAGSNQGRPQNKEHTTGEWRKNSIERALFIIECLGIIGLAYYCRVNYQEWRTFDSERVTMENEFQASQKSSERQLDEMKRSRELDERAWVGASDITASQQANGIVRFTVTFRNTGKTPAINFLGKIVSVPNSEYIPKQDDPKMPEASLTLLAPNESNFTWIDMPIDVIKTDGVYYLYGTSWYDDIFGKEHWSQFCFVVHCDTNGIIVVRTAAIHNSCDDVQTNQTN